MHFFRPVCHIVGFGKSVPVDFKEIGCSTAFFCYENSKAFVCREYIKELFAFSCFRIFHQAKALIAGVALFCCGGEQADRDDRWLFLIIAKYANIIILYIR